MRQMDAMDGEAGAEAAALEVDREMLDIGTELFKRRFYEAWEETKPEDLDKFLRGLFASMARREHPPEQPPPPVYPEPQPYIRPLTPEERANRQPIYFIYNDGG